MAVHCRLRSGVLLSQHCRLATSDKCTRMVCIAARQSGRAVLAELERLIIRELTRFANPDSIATADQLRY